MVPEPPASYPVVVQPPVLVQQPALDKLDDGQAPAAPTEEERLALEAVFAQRQHQPSPGASLLGAWAAGMLLNDVLQDHLAPPADEELDEEKAKKEKEPLPPAE